MATSSDTISIKRISEAYPLLVSVRRLLHIVSVSPDMKVEALIAADALLKKSRAVDMYTKMWDKYEAIMGGVGLHRDIDWIANQTAANKTDLGRLEQEVKRTRSNGVKEAVRLALCDIAKYYIDVDQADTAQSHYLRVRDYCLGVNQILTMCLDVAKSSFEMGNYPSALSFYTKGQAKLEGDEGIRHRLELYGGLSHLAAEDYRSAALCFLRISFNCASEWTEAATAADICVYAVVCALATFSRKDLREKILDSPSFREYSDEIPQLREAVELFHRAHYKEALAIVEGMKPMLGLDLYMRNHVANLYKKIRAKGVELFVKPYNFISIPDIATEFGVTAEEMHEEVVHMIENKQISAKVDDLENALVLEDVDDDLAVLEDVTDTIDGAAMRMKAGLVRLLLLRENFEFSEGKGLSVDDGGEQYVEDKTSKAAPSGIFVRQQSGAGMSMGEGRLTGGRQ